MGKLYEELKAVALRGGAGGGGGFTPTDAQLDAMNSGIDSEKVAQITINTSAISTKANTSDVSASGLFSK